jgi:hypothetical protein
VAMHSERGAWWPVRPSVPRTYATKGWRGAFRPEAGAARPCWWVISALEGFEGKESREAYYAGF